MNDTDDTATDTTVLPATSTPGGPVLTLGEAEKAANVSRSTLRRRLHAGDIPGAVRADDGSYAIPLAGLVEVGLIDEDYTDSLALDAAVELAELRSELAVERTRRQAAEAIAEERLRIITVLGQNLDDLRRQLPPALSAESDHTVLHSRWRRS